jgi:hypothetical protein
MAFPTTIITPTNVFNEDGVHARLDPATYDIPFAPDHIDLPGASGDYVSTPDSAQLSITGDIDIRAKVTPDDWTPSATQYIAGKWNSNGTLRDYILSLRDTGALAIDWYDSGGTARSLVSDVPSLSGTLWVRVSLDVDNGASDADARFYTSTDGATWTQSGATKSLGATSSIRDTAAACVIGARDGDGTLAFAGKIYRAQIYDGIAGTLVADFNPTEWTVGSSTYTDDQGNVWTLQGNATVGDFGGTVKTSHSRVFARAGTAVQTDANRVVQPAVSVANVDLPGASGDSVSTPDSAALSITGDLDVRCKVAVDDWTPVAGSSFMSQYDTANQRSWQFGLNTNGTLTTFLSTNGTSAQGTPSSSVATGFADGTAHWIRMTRTASSGDVAFYTSEDNVTWTQLGDSTAAIELGAYSASASANTNGQIYAAQIRDGIGGAVVANVDFTDASGFDPSLATYTDPQGNVWTFNGNAAATATNLLRDSHYQSDRTRTLKLEGAATNQITYSQEFDNAAWTNYGTIVVTANDAVAPDGSMTADKLDDTDGSSYSARMEDITVLNDSTTWCASVYVKKRSGGSVVNLVMNFRNGSGLSKSVNLDPSDGSVATPDGAPSYGATDEGDYWRLWMSTANDSSGNTVLRVRCHPAVGSSVDVVDGTDTGYAHFWGAQAENTAFPTSYIPTSGASASRVAERTRRTGRTC